MERATLTDHYALRGVATFTKAGTGMPDTHSVKWRNATGDARAACDAALDASNEHRREYGCSNVLATHQEAIMPATSDNADCPELQSLQQEHQKAESSLSEARKQLNASIGVRWNIAVGMVSPTWRGWCSIRSGSVSTSTSSSMAAMVRAQRTEQSIPVEKHPDPRRVF